ncbi:MAG: hypothetical protein EAY79_11290, partial [Runella slithyformis]
MYRFTGQNQNWLYSATYYDVKNRPIQTFAQNLYGQTERTDMEYNFAGEVLKMRQIHKDQNGNATTQVTENEYDHVGRLLKNRHGINNTPQEIARINYDAVGRLVQKKLMPNGTYSTGGTPASIVRPPNPGANNTQDIASQFICLQPGFETNA